MRVLNDAQIEQLLEVTRKGNPVAGTALYKIATDLKRLRGLIVRLVESHEDEEEVEKIVKEAMDYL
tara:strand:- start:879 stop:1076 length:198 start_codon:yes stop_codon:yes gene_type:complete